MEHPAVQEGCKNFVLNKFKSSINKAFTSKHNFCFETNFHTKDILKYLDLADKHGFEKHLIFIGLKSISLAKQRVALRVKNNGHFVPDNEIELRYNNGLRLLDQTFHRFENIIISESYPNYKSQNCIGIQGTKGYLVRKPSFMNKLPRLNQHIKTLERGKSIGFNI